MSDVVKLEGGEFLMGTDGPWAYSGDGEGPVHAVVLRPFAIEVTAVTNAAFREFVTATGFVTDAESYGWSFVFAGLLPDDFEETQGVVDAPWWRKVDGACWSRPEGPQSTIDDRDDHPVIHVSWQDAVAYATWRERRLPNEAEWEYAARGGLAGQLFPWGDDLEPKGAHEMNVWQGRFPTENTLADGHLGTAPVTSFAPNGFGLYNMTGNVWEWCADWYDPTFYASSPAADPTGPAQGMNRVMRGGSYLCHASYCRRYRVGARSANAPDTSTGNLGFRCAASV